MKGNQPTLFKQLKQLPWAQIPVGDRTRDRGHGRRETRTVKAVTVATPGGIGFPCAEQAIRITRTRTVASRTSRETALIKAVTRSDQVQHLPVYPDILTAAPKLRRITVHVGKFGFRPERPIRNRIEAS
ncbi:hypothetical protein [Actinoplanes rectilineatus]|uniref:hypothetical protein n=1 Tax=Actinoplanes rectilineatus TaxID=113571 RepID=UPI000A82C9B8|nr:hypothetical protein [Actinoplanes rectilineatus]